MLLFMYILVSYASHIGISAHVKNVKKIIILFSPVTILTTIFHLFVSTKRKEISIY